MGYNGTVVQSEVEGDIMKRFRLRDLPIGSTFILGEQPPQPIYTKSAEDQCVNSLGNMDIDPGTVVYWLVDRNLPPRYELRY